MSMQCRCLRHLAPSGCFISPEFEIIMECTQPKWILDRRDSGFLFWRRENECKRSVKFRCDVEVLEFLPMEDEGEEMAAPSALAAAICLTLIAATLSYQWLIH